MSRAAAASIALVFAACGPGERRTEALPPPPPPPTLADFAGRWNAVSYLEGVPDSVASSLIATGTAEGWQLLLPDRDPLPMQVWMQGDSLIAVSEQYPSILQKGVMVQLRNAGVLRDGEMVGTLLATYDSTGGQQVVKGTFRARRAPADTAGTP
jgi:hypothetical protein